MLTRFSRLSTAAACLLLGATLTACDSEPAAGAPRPAGGPPAGAAPAVAVETAAVQARPLTRELVAVGSVRSNESVTVRPEIGGRIAQIGFREGQSVRAGQLLFALDDAVYAAELAQAEAQHRLAARSLERAKELFGRKLISQADRDQVAANFDAAAATLALARAHLEKSRITAPFAGIAGLRQVSPGDYVSPGQDLVHLEAMDTVKVDFRVDEAALPRIKVGQSLAVEVDAWPGEVFEGEIYAIEPRVAEATRSIGLRARLPNVDGRLRPGQFARVRLAVGREDAAIVIPEQAIVPRGERQFVYVVEDGKAMQREVRVGQRLPGQAEILEGLAAGDQLVISGLQRLSPGAPVRALPPAAAPG